MKKVDVKVEHQETERVKSSSKMSIFTSKFLFYIFLMLLDLIFAIYCQKSFIFLRVKSKSEVSLRVSSCSYTAEVDLHPSCDKRRRIKLTLNPPWRRNPPRPPSGSQRDGVQRASSFLALQRVGATAGEAGKEKVAMEKTSEMFLGGEWSSTSVTRSGFLPRPRKGSSSPGVRVGCRWQKDRERQRERGRGRVWGGETIRLFPPHFASTLAVKIVMVMKWIFAGQQIVTERCFFDLKAGGVRAANDEDKGQTLNIKLDKVEFDLCSV